MQIAIDEAYLPATLTAPPMTDAEFAEFCAAYPDHLIEMTSDGDILIMPPNFSLTGVRNQKITTQLDHWAAVSGRGVTTEGTSGFVLPNGARRSPDAAWTRKDRIRALDRVSQETYWHLSPDFVIELRSKTDRLRTLREKMREWIGNGTELAWLIDPERRAVEIYRPGREAETLENPDRIAGEGPVEGFVLDLVPVWDPLA
jgi:Uma2 family endonuclease